MTSLKDISQVLFDKNAPLHELEKAIQSYKSLVLTVSQSSIENEAHRNHLQLDNGMAIGLKWAATCLVDVIRSQKFIRGTKKAIEVKLAEGVSPVRVVYAGTGPFATLILPLLDYFTTEELQVTLIEVNPESAANVSVILEQFKFEKHVEEIICADATSVVLPNSRKCKNSPFDILLSETMQHALQAELQVPICANLLHQMPNNALLIPQSIQLDLTQLYMESGNLKPIGQIGEFMKVDADFLRNEYPIDKEWVFRKQFDLGGLKKGTDSLIGIDTTICVFSDEIIEPYESGLTSPKIIGTFADCQANSQFIVEYAINPEPTCSMHSKN